MALFQFMLARLRSTADTHSHSHTRTCTHPPTHPHPHADTTLTHNIHIHKQYALQIVWPCKTRARRWRFSSSCSRASAPLRSPPPSTATTSSWQTRVPRVCGFWNLSPVDIPALTTLSLLLSLSLHVSPYLCADPPPRHCGPHLHPLRQPHRGKHGKGMA